MNKADVIYLITESSTSRGIYDTPTTTERMVYATVRSVGMRENYAALSSGFLPELVFVLALSEEYDGEKLAKYNGQYYKIIRVYHNDHNGVELTVQRRQEDE